MHRANAIGGTLLAGTKSDRTKSSQLPEPPRIPTLQEDLSANAITLAALVKHRTGLQRRMLCEPDNTKALTAYMSYLDTLIDARHHLAILSYERRTRVFLIDETAWTAQMLAVAREVEVAQMAYEAMLGEVEVLGVAV